MDKFSTPTPALSVAESSVFLTPPSSNSKPLSLPRPSVLPPIPFLSPFATPKSADSPEEHKDILSALHLGGYPAIADQILSLLTPADLSSCLHVCQLWHHLISSRSHLLAKVSAYQRQRKENAENLVKAYVPTIVAPAQRRILGIIAPNIQAPVRSKPAPLPFKPFPHGIIHKYRPCPNCQSPAKELNLRRAECSNASCNFDFCQKCFKPWHNGECSILRSPEKRRRENEAIVGTKKSKKRLRRL